jgi:hypothetical protein
VIPVLEIRGGCADDLSVYFIVVRSLNYLEISFTVVTVIELLGTSVGMPVYPEKGQVLIAAFGTVNFIHKKSSICTLIKIVSLLK